MTAVDPRKGQPAGLVARVRALVTPQFLRYIGVGVFNTVFGYGVFALLWTTLGSVLNVSVVLIIATVIAVTVAFLLQRYVVFRVRGRFFGDLWRFSGIYGVVLVLNLAVLPVLYGWIGLPVLVSQAVFTGVITICTFVLNRTFTFRRPAPAPSDPPNEVPS